MQELAELANEQMGGSCSSIVGGVMRLNGTDATVAVCRTDYEDERGIVFVWVPGLTQWRMRRDVDADEATGLMEWRRIRETRRKGIEYDGD